MKKLLLFSFLLTAFAGINTAGAQNPLVKQWDYRFGGTSDEFLFTFSQTTDGGYILGGYTLSDSSGDKTQPSWGAYDFWIVKMDSLGNKQWDKRFGGNSSDYLTSLQQTSDGGYVLGGDSNSGISGDKTEAPRGGLDYWIIKIDSLGNKQWDKRFGGFNDDGIYSLQQTFDGGYILGGVSLSGIGGDKSQPSWSGYDYWIVKTDSAGNKQWDKDFGASGADLFNSLQQTTDGGFILGGYSDSGISGDKTQNTWGSYDYWIVKIDSLGTKQWDKDFGGTYTDLFYSLQQTSDRGFILGGISNSPISGDKTQNIWGSYDYWIVKIDSLGTKQWDKDFGGTDDEDGFSNVFQTSDSGYLLGGTSQSNISGDKTENNLGPTQTWIVKTDSLGNKQWDKTIFTTGHDEQGLTVQSNDGCFVIANHTASGIGGYKTQANWDPTNTSYDYWIIKFCDTTLTTSIQSAIPNSQSAITISPNPAQDLLTISDNATGKKEIEIYDLFGRRVLNTTFHPDTSGHSTFTIDISTLSPGIYFLKAGNEVRKFVKE